MPQPRLRWTVFGGRLTIGLPQPPGSVAVAALTHPDDAEPSGRTAAHGAADGAAVSVRGLSWRYAGAARPAVSGLSFALQPGGLMVVVGPLGAGRTTLARALSGIVPHRFAGEWQGSVEVAGADVTGTPLTELGARVGLVGPDTRRWPLMTRVADEVTFPLVNRGWRRDDIDERLHELLAFVGLVGAARTPIEALSAGHVSRLALAAAIAPRPAVLVLDEPTAYLDARARSGVLDLIRRLRAGREATVVVSDRHAGRLLDIADTLLLLDASGRQLYCGPPAGAGASDVAQAQRAGAWPVAAGAAEPVEPRRFASTPAGQWSHPLLSARQLRLDLWADHRRTRRPLFAGLDLDLEAGHRVALTGLNGAGASALISALNGELRPAAGTVRVGDGTAPPGDEPGRLHGVRRARLLMTLGEQADQALRHRTVAWEVSGGARDPRRDPAAWPEVEVILERFLAWLPSDGDPALLSDAQQRLLGLAAALFRAPGILLLDQPEVGLDRRAWTVMVEALDEMRALGQAQLIATHDELLITRADRVVNLSAAHAEH